MGLRCQALCVKFPDEPMCGTCRAHTGAPFGASIRQFEASITRISRSAATPHGSRGTVRQKHQNRTWKYMRVRGGDIKHNFRLQALKMRAGEARWDEAEHIRLQKDAVNALWSTILKTRN